MNEIVIEHKFEHHISTEAERPVDFSSTAINPVARALAKFFDQYNNDLKDLLGLLRQHNSSK